MKFSSLQCLLLVGIALYTYHLFYINLYAKDIVTLLDYSEVCSKLDSIEISEDDIDLLTKLINSESHSENMTDKLLVGSVVLNRIKSDKFPNTLSEVILQPNQFSGINSTLFRSSLDTPSDCDSKTAAIHVLMHGPIDSTLLYFINHKIATNTKWSNILKKEPVQIQTRHHHFYGDL